MRLHEIFNLDMLKEVAVDSSWISDIEHTGDGVEMELIGGRTYYFPEVPEDMFQNWLDSDSKGRFWNQNLRGIYLAA